MKVNVQATVPQQTAGVVSLVTGKYVKRTTTLTTTQPVCPGGFHRLPGDDPQRKRAARGQRHGQHCRHRPPGKTILTGPSDANGIADGIWKTSAPSRKSTGTPSGDYTGTVNGVTASGYVWDATATSVTFNLK